MRCSGGAAAERGSQDESAERPENGKMLAGQMESWLCREMCCFLFIFFCFLLSFNAWSSFKRSSDIKEDSHMLTWFMARLCVRFNGWSVETPEPALRGHKSQTCSFYCAVCPCDATIDLACQAESCFFCFNLNFTFRQRAHGKKRENQK